MRDQRRAASTGRRRPRAVGGHTKDRPSPDVQWNKDARESDGGGPYGGLRRAEWLLEALHAHEIQSPKVFHWAELPSGLSQKRPRAGRQGRQPRRLLEPRPDRFFGPFDFQIEEKDPDAQRHSSQKGQC